MAPFFISGPNCKIKVNGVTMAFATELSVEVSIQHQQAKVLGMYEADTIEPISYNITGSFVVIKYIEGAKAALEKAGFTAPHGATNLGNGIGSMGSQNSIVKSAGLGDGRLQEALDPSKLGIATGFDIELYQVMPKGTVPGSTDFDIRSSRLYSDNATDTKGILRLRDCHITGMRTSITKKGVMMQSYNFISNYIDEDSFLSSPSDFGQRIQ
jgi:hypothetical protein